MPNKNTLFIGGCDAVSLAERFGTPLYAYDEEGLRAKARIYPTIFAKYWPGEIRVAYAAKAFWCLAMARLIKDEGLWADTASAGEFYTALKAGIPASRLYVHGNCKTKEELISALEEKAARIVVDGVQELEMLERLAKKKKKRPVILLRLTLGIEAGGHHHIRTGHADTKFGIHVRGGEALRAAKYALESSHLELAGFHAHLGSQIFNLAPYRKMISLVFDFLQDLKKETGKTVPELNLGGGWAVPYAGDPKPPAVDEYAKYLSACVIRECQKRPYPPLILTVELGRSIAAQPGVTLYTVHYVKKLPNGKTYVIVDGGISDNPRPALYGAKYHAAIAGRAQAKADKFYTVAGKHCESDILIENVRLASPQCGDILAVFTTGAYNYSMASNYNRYARPAVVFCKNGKARIVVKRETLNDLVCNDL